MRRRRRPGCSASSRPEGTRPPFFFLHGDYINGGFYCRKIAEQLDADQPMVALLPHGLDGTPVPETIEAMAESYIRADAHASADGPYRLGGSCNGGLIAYEMARQLRAGGAGRRRGGDDRAAGLEPAARRAGASVS